VETERLQHCSGIALWSIAHFLRRCDEIGLLVFEELTGCISVMKTGNPWSYGFAKQ
jgi:beta-galactosidase/beta-glucuronidase